ncbi:MAG: hypothetical protein HY820_31565 [Acidobacteria bacterium]|nr:hypothetical protein [Acidobacteriota bacterium]
MNTNLTKMTLAAAAAVLLATITPSHLSAQPPAQGPAPASSNANDLGVDLITAVVRNKVKETVATTNANLATNPSYRAVLSPSQQHSLPYMRLSTYLDRPNQFYANVPYHITYKVTGIKAKIAGVWVPYPFSRTLSQTINVQTTCEGWYTGKGTLALTALIERPYLEGDHSFIEDAIGFLLMNFIPDYVDSQIRGALSGMTGAVIPSSVPLPCATLGVATTAMGFSFDSIRFDPPNALQVNTAFLPKITVRVVQVKRLTVHKLTGEVVGDVVETPELEFWAGHSVTGLQMASMVEGQTWFPSVASSVPTPVPSGTGLLVLIGNLLYNGGIREDNSYATYSKATNYGNGTQTFNVMKTWFDPPLLPGGKPVKRTAPGYQITVQISVPTTLTLSR